MMKGHSFSGTMTQGSIHKLLAPMTQQDKGSALLNTEGMYVGMMDKLVAARRVVVLPRVSLWAGLCEQPFQKDEITELLSQQIFKQASCQPLWVSQAMDSSVAVSSAQLMSQPSSAHPPRSLQVAQRQPTNNNQMPQGIEASTQMSRSNTGSFKRTHKGFVTERVHNHHNNWWRQDLWMWWRMWSLGNLDKGLGRAERYSWPCW